MRIERPGELVIWWELTVGCVTVICPKLCSIIAKVAFMVLRLFVSLGGVLSLSYLPQKCVIRPVPPAQISLQWPLAVFPDIVNLHELFVSSFALAGSLQKEALCFILSESETAVVAGGTQMVLFEVTVEGGGPHKGAHRPDTREADR